MKTTPDLVLYHFDSCPYCRKVRRAIQELTLEVEERNILKSEEFKNELVKGGGKSQVPCLRIEKSPNTYEWLYESDDIIRFLESRFSK